MYYAGDILACIYLGLVFPNLKVDYPFLVHQDNGGAPITNYVVEKQNTKTGEWSTVSTFVRGTDFDVSGLEDGHMYRFRVRAANEYGTSEPLEGDKAILAENPYSKLRLCYIHAHVGICWCKFVNRSVTLRRHLQENVVVCLTNKIALTSSYTV